MVYMILQLFGDLTNNTPDRIDANELWVDCAA